MKIVVESQFGLHHGTLPTDERFAAYGTANAMVANVTCVEVCTLEEELKAIKGVQSVSFDETTDHYCHSTHNICVRTIFLLVLLSGKNKIDYIDHKAQRPADKNIGMDAPNFYAAPNGRSQRADALADCTKQREALCAVSLKQSGEKHNRHRNIL